MLLGTYAALYKVAASNLEATKQSLKAFNESTQYRKANSIINNMIAYGEPFEYQDFNKLDPSRLDGVLYDPSYNRYTYKTYSRW